MKIISVYGGPRKKGNTATILNWVEGELLLLGHQVECINIASKNIQGYKKTLSAAVSGRRSKPRSKAMTGSWIDFCRGPV